MQSFQAATPIPEAEEAIVPEQGQACIDDRRNILFRSGFPSGRGSRSISADQATQYANRVGTNDSSLCYVIQVLTVGRIVYGKRSPGVPPGSGDCGSQTSIDLGFASKVSTGLKIEAAASTLGPLAFLPTPGIIFTAPFEIFSLFGAHHAQAVAREQATLCDVAVAYNQFADAIEAALQAEKITSADAIRYSDPAVNQLVDAMRPIRKECNFACGMTYAVRALGLYNKEVFYPSFAKPAGLFGTASGKEEVIGSIIGAIGGLLLR